VWRFLTVRTPVRKHPGLARESFLPRRRAPEWWRWCRWERRASALYPEFVAQVEEICGKSAGFRPKGTLEALFSHDTKAELSTIIALHHGLGLKAEPLRAADARELEPALSEEVEAAVLRPEEASVDNRALTDAILEEIDEQNVPDLKTKVVLGFGRHISFEFKSFIC